MEETSAPAIPELIRRKRDGEALTGAAIRHFVDGVVDGSVDDAQLGAFLMAIYLRGMAREEQAALTLAMRDSGEVMRWPGLDGPVLDKHSTGGVGDLVSLVLAPLVAACGGFVPMISGRGLGHTGGTLDKLESIPGFNVNPDRASLERLVREAGFAMVGQGDELAPADRRMYAARDVTATVACKPLIISSILCKKLSEGLDGLVMDIKVGNGAFMERRDEAISLGQELCDVAAAAGLRCTALVTDMNQPLANAAGNALEVKAALGFLAGKPTSPRLQDVVYGLAGELLQTGGLAEDEAAARSRLEAAIANGSAAERFARVVAMQGGPGDLLERPDHHLPAAPVVRAIEADQGGWVRGMNTLEIGLIVRDLGGGRVRASDAIDPAVGLSGLAVIGDRVAPGDALAFVHAADDAAAERAAKRLRAAMLVSETAVGADDAVVLDRLGARRDNQRDGVPEA